MGLRRLLGWPRPATDDADDEDRMRKNILITGASSGFGEQMAHSLAALVARFG
ncbi:MAG: hypothetical protein ACRDQ5_27225 [Sciscionella sp.]